MTTKTKDLTKQAPTSPRHRTGGYAILSRMADKARADIAGKMGEYHTNCPLDHMLLDWKGVEYAGVRKALEGGGTDEEIAKYLDTHGTPKTREEIRAWSDGVDKATMHGDPEKGSGSTARVRSWASTLPRPRCSSGWKLTTARVTRSEQFTRSRAFTKQSQ